MKRNASDRFASCENGICGNWLNNFPCDSDCFVIGRKGILCSFHSLQIVDVKLVTMYFFDFPAGLPTCHLVYITSLHMSTRCQTQKRGSHVVIDGTDADDERAQQLESEMRPIISEWGDGEALRSLVDRPGSEHCTGRYRGGG